MVKRTVAIGIMLVLLAPAACRLLPGVGDEPTAAPQPATATPDPAKGEGGLESLGGGFVYTEMGGIAGLCNVVTLTMGQPATVASCHSDPPEMMGSVTLSAGQNERLADLVSRVAPFRFEHSDPATADGMTVIIDFTGAGTAEPSDDDHAEIRDLVLEVQLALRE